ncbi:MAG TPA: DUF5996 family protein [Pyrinomonadaceae bacterium]|nr:DUF5996 family protein [Pyrinomonadaceae bacterium]
MTEQLNVDAGGEWPSLPFAEWAGTCATLHMWTQIVGKVRLAQAPHVNHWWQVPLYVSARGLTTSAVPYGPKTFQIDFDFISHKLSIATSDGGARELELAPRSVADFYREFTSRMGELGLDVKIWTTPVEVPDPIPFERDETHKSYDAEYANRFWRALAQSERVFQRFRSGFTGKCSPVHFFWGSFDLAVTRFSGRRAPEHPGAPGVADSITREAYSHEVSSAGFWPGGPALAEPIFYSYAYPEPEGFKDAPARPASAYYNTDFREFVLPYEAVRTSEDPERDLSQFLQDTYEAAANLADWDRASLERAAAAS